jgi:AbrB family looped-hinge helix DNA binding protein
MPHATLSSKFQISIPKEVRERMNLQPGQKVGFIERGGLFYFARVPTFDELRGSMKGSDTTFERDRTDRLERYKHIKPAPLARKAA